MGEQHNPKRILGWGSDENGLFVKFKEGTRRWPMSQKAAKQVAIGINHQYWGKPTEAELKEFERLRKEDEKRSQQFEKEIQEGKRKRPVFRARSWFGQQMKNYAQEEKESQNVQHEDK